MRRLCTGFLALGLALVLAVSAMAQSYGTFFQPGQRTANLGTTFAPKTVVNVPIDTSQAVAPFPGQSGSFSIAGFFRNMKLPILPPSVGQSPLPPPSAFPSTKYASGKAVTQKLLFPNLTPFVPASYRRK